MDGAPGCNRYNYALLEYQAVLNVLHSPEEGGGGGYVDVHKGRVGQLRYYVFSRRSVGTRPSRRE